MESYYEKMNKIATLQKNLFNASLELIQKIKKLYDDKKISEKQFQSADLILSLTSYNLGCCSKKYTLGGLQKIQDKFKKYDEEINALDK